MPPMIISSIDVIPIRLPLREPFVVAYASYPDTLSVLVRNRTRWPFEKLVSHTYPLEQINKAFAESEWHGRDTTTITRAALAP